MNPDKPADALYARPLDKIDAFTFDEKVASVFDDMINRSVPGYRTVVGLTGLIAKHFYQPASHCYDLGCSLGATTLAMAQYLPTEAIIIGVDNSAPMITRCQQAIATLQPRQTITLLCQDIQTLRVEQASIVTLNYTLQFIPPQNRLAVLSTIYRGMLPGGALLLSEKISLDNVHDDELFTELHHDYKRENGYSDLEISQKRSALENVLIRDSLQQHRERLQEAGFSRIQTWFQCFNFMSLLAIK